MGRKAHQAVHGRLTEWADSAPPVPTPALAQFMGPVRPRPGSGRAVRAAVRTGLGIKVFGLLAATAVTGAAAVGVTQVAQHEPDPPAPVVVPALPSAAPADRSTTAPDDDPSTSASPSTTTPPRATPSASPRVHRTHSAAPAPSTRPSSHESERSDPPSPEGGDQPDPTSDPTSDAADAAPADTGSVDTPPGD